jgi:hypothetical protein
MTPAEKYQASLLSDPETCGSVLLAVALLKYKESVYQVDPMTLILNLEDDFRVRLPEDNENKLKAILLATETTLFQHDPEAFRAVCITLWNGDPQLEHNEPLSLTEAIWGMFEVKTCFGELSLGPAVQAVVEGLSDEEIQDPEASGDPYSHIGEGVRERYGVWRDQMLGLGAEAKDIPALEA